MRTEICRGFSSPRRFFLLFPRPVSSRLRTFRHRLASALSLVSSRFRSSPSRLRIASALSLVSPRLLRFPRVLPLLLPPVKRPPPPQFPPFQKCKSATPLTIQQNCDHNGVALTRHDLLCFAGLASPRFPWSPRQHLNC